METWRTFKHPYGHKGSMHQSCVSQHRVPRCCQSVGLYPRPTQRLINASNTLGIQLKHHPCLRSGMCAAAHQAGGMDKLPSATTTSTSPVNPVITENQADDFAFDIRPVILYDGVCNLCNKAVNIMLDWDPEGKFRLAALQSPAGQRLLRRSGRAPDDISSIVLVEKDKHYIRSEAILRIAYGMSNPFPLLALMGFPVPVVLRDFVYDRVASNRYSFFGKRDVCRLSDDGFKGRFISG